MRLEKATTIRNVAKAAELSIISVSRYLNGDIVTQVLRRNRNLLLLDGDVAAVSASRIFSENWTGRYLATR